MYTKLPTGKIRESKYIIWMPNWQFNCLKTSTVMQMDGSFSIVPAE